MNLSTYIFIFIIFHEWIRRIHYLEWWKYQINVTIDVTIDITIDMFTLSVNLRRWPYWFYLIKSPLFDYKQWI